jgi:flagellar biosynthesis/type III secretory pathway M-ring protein FliF/YscJ
VTRDVVIGLALLVGVTVLTFAWAVLEHRRAERRRRQERARAQRPERVLDLEAAGAKVTYRTDRTYDYDKAIAAKRRAERRQAEMRQLAAQQGQPGAVAKFRRRG